MNRERGQVVLILILVMTVALAIGISVVQRSLSDISTSTKVEESSRAFSAAEAGIEQALNSGSTIPVTFAENQSGATVTKTDLLPVVSIHQDALEFPPLSKEQTAHVWLADYRVGSNPPPAHYIQNTLDIYWGDPIATDKAALELTLIYYDGAYKTTKWYLSSDSSNTTSSFVLVTTCSTDGKIPQGSTTKYLCYKQLTGLPANLMMITARLLYNSTSQPFAVQAVGTCAVASAKDCSIPPQATVFISTGTAGQTQRRIKLFQIEKVAPPYFDYGLFSAGEINK